MNSKLYNQIRTYYLFGYGCPVKTYSKETLDLFVEKGLLTAVEAQELKAEKGECDGLL